MPRAATEDGDAASLPTGISVRIAEIKLFSSITGIRLPEGSTAGFSGVLPASGSGSSSIYSSPRGISSYSSPSGSGSLSYSAGGISGLPAGRGAYVSAGCLPKDSAGCGETASSGSCDVIAAGCAETAAGCAAAASAGCSAVPVPAISSSGTSVLTGCFGIFERSVAARLKFRSRSSSSNLLRSSSRCRRSSSRLLRSSR